MSVTARVNLQEIQAELTDEHKVDEIQFDAPNTSLTISALLSAATNAAGLASRTNDFALWIVNDQNDLLSRPLSLAEIVSPDSFLTVKYGLRKRHLNKDTKNFTKNGAKAELAGPYEQVLEKSRQLFGSYNKWTSSNTPPDAVDQALNEFTHALEAFVEAVKQQSLPTESFEDLQEQVADITDTIGELQSARGETGSPNKKKNKKKKTGSQQEMGLSFEKQTERFRTRLNSFLSQVCVHIHFVATCTDALAAQSAATPSSESPRQISEANEPEPTQEANGKADGSESHEEPTEEGDGEDAAAQNEISEPEEVEEGGNEDVAIPSQKEIAELLVLTDQKILNIEAESQVGKSQTPQESKPETPQKSKPQTPQEAKPQTPQEVKPQTPQQSKPQTPQESKPKTPQEANSRGPQGGKGKGKGKGKGPAQQAPKVEEVAVEVEVEGVEEVADDDTDQGAANVTAVFLQHGGETKKSSLFLAGPPFAPKVLALFEKKFGHQGKKEKIYICDPGSAIFYELENYHAINEGSILKLFDPAKSGFEAADGGSLAQDVRAIKSLILSEQFQQILTTPARLEAENKKILDEKLASIEAERTKLSKNIKDTKAAQKKLAGKLRLELDQMKGAALHLKSILNADLTAARGKLEQTKEAYKKLLEETKTPVRELETEKGYINAESDAINQKLEDLKDIIDQVKVDVTKRKSKPSRAHLTYIKEESEALVERIEKLLDRLKTGKATRKKIWEGELQSVMKEQKIFKDFEEVVPGYEDELQEQLELFDKLEKIAQMQEKRKATPLEFFPPDDDVELDQKDRVGALLSAIQSKQLSEEESNRRLKAMALAEKSRKIELEKKVDEFEDELNNFVGKQKFKNRGCFEEIERKRQERDRLLLKGLPIEDS